MKNRKEVHVNPSHPRGCVERLGIERCGYKTAKCHAHKHILLPNVIPFLTTAIHYSVYIVCLKINYNIDILFALILLMNRYKY
jgi:hypothetical protein